MVNNDTSESETPIGIARAKARAVGIVLFACSVVMLIVVVGGRMLSSHASASTADLADEMGTKRTAVADTAGIEFSDNGITSHVTVLDSTITITNSIGSNHIGNWWLYCHEINRSGYTGTPDRVAVWNSLPQQVHERIAVELCREVL